MERKMKRGNENIKEMGTEREGGLGKKANVWVLTGDKREERKERQLCT